MANPDQPSDAIIEIAVDAAKRSPCAKSKRGVVIFERGITSFRIHSVAHNSPPWPYECDGSAACQANGNCWRVAVHAEERAILDGGKLRVGTSHQVGLEIELLHVKVVDGELVPGKGPSCELCSKLILEAGIDRVWLFQADESEERWPPGIEPVRRGVWNSYDALGFHRITLRNLGLYCHI